MGSWLRSSWIMSHEPIKNYKLTYTLYTMYCTHYTGIGARTANHCFLLYNHRSVPFSGFYIKARQTLKKWSNFHWTTKKLRSEDRYLQWPPVKYEHIVLFYFLSGGSIQYSSLSPVKFSSFWCSFRENFDAVFGKIWPNNRLAIPPPLPRNWRPPHSGKSWIRHCRSSDYITYSTALSINQS